MIITTDFKRDKEGSIEAPQSEYEPTQEESDITEIVMRDFEHGNLLMNQTFHEFNDLSVTDRLNRDKLNFNTYLPDDGEVVDSVDSWKSNAQRPTERNRSLDIAAQVSQETIFPKIFAQNEKDEEDRQAGTVMRYLMEWSADQQDYDKTQLYSIITSLYSPAALIHTEYTENFKIKFNEEKNEDEEVIDEENSGFTSTIIPCNELFIENMYQHDIQKQGFLIWRKVISYDVAENKYGKSKNWKHVKPQLQTKFDPMTQMYYDQQDETLTENQVEEVIYWNRNRDIKLNYVNGIIQSEYNAPNPRQDGKFPIVKFGYELIDEGKFFYFKSSVFKLQPDARNANELWRMFIDAAYLNAFSPMVITGEEEASSDVVAPGAVTTFANPDTTITPINTGSNNTSTMNALNMLEESLRDSTSAPVATPVTGQQTAFETATIQENALTNLGMFAKMVGFGVKDWGVLMVSDILQYLTIGDAMNIISDDSRLNFKNFLLPEQSLGGKRGPIKIEFDLEMPEDEKGERAMEMDLMEREGGIDNDSKIFKVNPAKFRDMKYLIKVVPDLVVRPNESQNIASSERTYDRLIRNPLVNQEENLRMLLESNPKTGEDPDKFINEAPALEEGNKKQDTAGTPAQQ